MKRGIVLAGFSALFLTICLFGSPIAMARTPFDGAWSVLIITDRGTCDRAYRYALRIADGLVYYDDPSFSVSGGVDGAGCCAYAEKFASRTAAKAATIRTIISFPPMPELSLCSS